MEHAQEGPCCVCGVTTTHRCSPCAENGFDLFLCGREHQKLIWFAHKRVCGVKSNPFQFPFLSKKEAECAKRIAFEPVSFGPTDDTTTLAKELSNLIQLNEAEVPAIIDLLSQPETRVLKHSALLPGVFLCCCRAFVLHHGVYQAHATQESVGTPNAYIPVRTYEPQLVSGYCADRLANSLAGLTGHPDDLSRDDIVNSYALSERWYIKLFHQLVVCASLAHRDVKRTVQAELEAPLLSGADGAGAVKAGEPYRGYLRSASNQLWSAVEPLKGDPRYPAVVDMLELAEASFFARKE